MPITNTPLNPVETPHPVARPRKADWQRHLRRVERYVERGDYARAISALESAAAEGADSYACRLRIASLYCAMQAWPRAIEAAEQAALMAPERLDAYELVMALALETGDYDRVLRACEAVIKRSPRHLLAHTALGAAYIRRGDTDAAMRVFNTLTRLDPDSPAHHFTRGLLFQHKSEVALAVHEFEETIRLDADGPHADAAREALETLDSYQLNQIFTLAMEDAVFRTGLARDAAETAAARGFALSETGTHLLVEIIAQALPDLPAPARTQLYN